MSKLVVICGNNNGELFIYVLKEEEKKLKLLDMVFTNDSAIIRIAYFIDDKTLVTSNENNKLQLHQL